MRQAILTLALLLPIAACNAANTDSGRQYSDTELGDPPSFRGPATSTGPFSASTPMRRRGFRGTAGQTTIDESY
jgi:hypothetical protein